jgi:hypothetical protein
MLTHATADGLRRRQPELAGRLFAAATPARLFCPGVGTRVVARARAAALDQALADGADPTECPRLAARAADLTAPSNRRRLAATVERFVAAAGLPRQLVTIQPARRAILANRGALLELASVLRGQAPVYARGLAQLTLALRDGAGPLYVDHHDEVLARQIAVVSAALRG